MQSCFFVYLFPPFTFSVWLIFGKDPERFFFFFPLPPPLPPPSNPTTLNTPPKQPKTPFPPLFHSTIFRSPKNVGPKSRVTPPIIGVNRKRTPYPFCESKPNCGFFHKFEPKKKTQKAGFRPLYKKWVGWCGFWVRVGFLGGIWRLGFFDETGPLVGTCLSTESHHHNTTKPSPKPKLSSFLALFLSSFFFVVFSSVHHV